jgi:hypothetical protein
MQICDSKERIELVYVGLESYGCEVDVIRLISEVYRSSSICTEK